MPNWDDPRRPGGYRSEYERWRGGVRDRYGRALGPERRTFGEGRELAAHERFDWRDEDAGAAGYRGARNDDEDSRRFGGEPHAHGGQEYGVEGHGGADRRGGWELERGSDRLQNFDMDDPGTGQGSAGYARPPDLRKTRPHPDDDLDLEYLLWRDEQLRDHDRDYAEWRRHQHAQYDAQYRQFRKERRELFGRAFHDWRSQRSVAAGMGGGQAEPAEPAEEAPHPARGEKPGAD